MTSQQSDTPTTGSVTPTVPDADTDQADVSGADTSVTSGVGADVGARSKESGNPSLVAGVTVDDLDDVEQVAALLAGPGMSFRGGGADWWRDGETYEEPGWLRTSRDPHVATDNFTADGVVVLFGSTGRDVAPLTDHAAEQETVFLPGSRFTILCRAEVGGEPVTVVRVSSDGDTDASGSDVTDLEVDDAVTRATNVLTRARTLPPQPVARPGRFSGEFGQRR